MFKKLYLFCLVMLFSIPLSITIAKESFFSEAEEKYNEKKIKESKFLFQRNIVHNPKHANSYLYLAKIYNLEENQIEEEKNLNTALLLDPENEEIIYMLINVELKKSNYSKVKILNKDFEIVCVKLCDNLEQINETLKNIEPENES